MKKIIMLVAVIAAAVSLTGCKAPGLQDHKYGAYAGIIAYQSYNRIVENVDTNNPVKVEIINCVSNLWVSFDSIASLDDEVKLRDMIKEASDKLYNKLLENKFGDTNYRQQILMKHVYKLYEQQLDRLVSTDSTKRKAAIKWLAAFREGIRLMYAIDHGKLYGVDAATNVMAKDDDGSMLLISKAIEDLSKVLE